MNGDQNYLGFVLDFKNFEEKELIVSILNDRNEIKKTLIKNYKANKDIIQIGNLINYKLFGRENSLGFINYSNVKSFGSLSFGDKIKSAIILCSSFLILNILEKTKIYYNLFDEFKKVLENLNDIKKNKENYLNFEYLLIKNTGFIEECNIKKMNLNEINEFNIKAFEKIKYELKIKQNFNFSIARNIITLDL